MPFFPIWVHCLLPFKGRLPPSSLLHLCLQPGGHWYQTETQRCRSQHIKVSTWASLADEQNRLVWDQQSLESSALKSKLRIFLPLSLWCRKQNLTPKVDPGLDLSPTGVWLLSSVRWLQLCLSEPPPGPREWRSQGSVWPWYQLTRSRHCRLCWLLNHQKGFTEMNR